MMELKRFSLNRIAAPSVPLRDFFKLALAAGISKVELRNDIGGADPIDGLEPAEAARLAGDLGIEILTINALQKFNLASVRAKASSDLDSMLALARAVGCRAIVLCPNNAADDSRSAARRAIETAEALAEFGPRFMAAGILGYVEPLGFGISSLDSLVAAQEAIAKSGFSCYRIVHDTFHFHIGPEDLSVLGSVLNVSNIGLVHISGVELDIPTGDYRDAHRILVGPADRMKSREQIRTLEGLGYAGDFSFEPFAAEIQKLGERELVAALRKSIEYLSA
ncbi:MAG TPA: TIM barrel protein [Rectinemataceae bacterium]|nr:TIM barrel protein [Rectinemataceae bacterium]